MTNSRQQDVSEAERFIAAVQEHGAAPLPSLLAVDMCVLGAAEQSLFDEPVLRTWADLSPEARDELVLHALNGLRARRLIRAPKGSASDGSFEVTVPLGFIMAARAQPAFVAVCEADGRSRGAPRMYGVADEEYRLRAVVVEYVSRLRVGFGTGQKYELDQEADQQNAGDLNAVYMYVLVSPQQAAETIGDWMTDRSTPRALRRADVYWHKAGEQLKRATITIENGSKVQFHDPNGRARAGEPGNVTTLVTDLINEACRR